MEEISEALLKQFSLSSHAKDYERKLGKPTSELAKILAGISKRLHVVEEASSGKNTVWGGTNGLSEQRKENDEKGRAS